MQILLASNIVLRSEWRLATTRRLGCVIGRPAAILSTLLTQVTRLKVALPEALRFNMRYPRFGLRILLALPLCVAAFYFGWTAHTSHVRSQHNLEKAAAKQQSSDVHRELSHQRAVRDAGFNELIERLEHRERMESYERLLNDPTAVKLQPEVEF